MNKVGVLIKSYVFQGEIFKGNLNPSQSYCGWLVYIPLKSQYWTKTKSEPQFHIVSLHISLIHVGCNSSLFALGSCSVFRFNPPTVITEHNVLGYLASRMKGVCLGLPITKHWVTNNVFAFRRNILNDQWRWMWIVGLNYRNCIN